MVKLHCYGPGWTIPCISPYVTKTAYYMDLAGIDYEITPADPFALKATTPHGKLPTIEDDDGTEVADSTAIIKHFEATRNNPLDGGMSEKDKATAMAFNRLLDEHFYWAAVVQPRWREQHGWEAYIPIILGGATPDAATRDALEDFRRMVMAEFDGQGMGRLTGDKVYARAREDVDALAGQLADNEFFLGDTCRSIDANVLSLCKHVAESPFDFDTKSYMQGKPDLMAYIGRLSRRLRR